MASMSLSTVRSLAEAAFSKSKATVNPPSKIAEAPSSSSTEPDKDNKGDVVDDPTSDAALSLSSSFPSFASFKDQRAFEHDRQRVKRTEEYVRMREAKVSKRATAFSKMSIAFGASSAPPAARVKERWTGSGFGTDSELDHDTVSLARGDEQPGRLGAPAGTTSPPPLHKTTEVKLADLITQVSVRNSRKGMRKDPDFELIPAVRSVIVLDELAFMHDTPPPRDLEQEWEHVCHSDGDESSESESSRPSSKIVPTLTYADVVVSGGLN
ncbi:hypothetical protein GYMLUDRAFT_337786 [Collybiopsis luxurians FD-317 M1]|nr:hypothetical protein GYMLUDRAFT_337786 [Collybiopsis luxurians FD-317 M1]